MREAAEAARDAAGKALGARDDLVEAAQALRDGLADQQRQLDELRETTEDMKGTIVPKTPKAGV
ncbi:MAG: hypothetical protein A3H96_20040 [Acidobacteria bacterium RIFCSPLOWO2_02_FULL_67_36]|nr:MAG: hypothetical protein A3H96_20040 [Acidobacteria bacterium RIFCSPLOWO2_02_FULL_67_36]OFW23332.1 MAG: hypothetical protein A3G21_10545 [Acidobacteria bacterium RIFCSPLOWO2_12_FULL_66_21]